MMKNNKLRKVLALAMVVACAAGIFPKVQAAQGVDLTEKCALEVDVTGSGFVELDGSDPQVTQRPVTIRLYQVADINAAGKYTAKAPFVLDFSSLNADKEAAAQVWKELSASAKTQVDKLLEDEQITASATDTTTAGKVLFSDLSVGLYLVDAEKTASDYYEYHFTPYLISLPNNYYYDEKNPGDDTWVYSLTGTKAVGLKPEKLDLFGDLEITKFLDTYNETLGGATFVFQVEGYKEDNDTGARRNVYSDVVSLAFDKPGSESLVLRKLPAGAELTVTEVYSGASYTLTSGAAQTITLEAKAAEDENFANVVQFANTGDGGLNGGTGMVNSFTYDSQNKSWGWAASSSSMQK